MTSERITVTAADLQPGDRIIGGSWAEPSGHEVGVVIPIVSIDGEHVRPDAEFTVDRPVPTTTLTFDVPESKREAVEQAVQQVLTPSVKVGDRVRRTLPHGPGDGDEGWQYEPGATGTMNLVLQDGSIEVVVDDDHEYVMGRTWRAGSFEVVPS